MEEDFNPVVEQPFTQADSLQLQRLNQDLASITSKVNEGILYPQEADPEKADILKERQALIGRQQQAQLAQRGQQRMHMQDEHANQVMMGMEATKANANQFTQMMPLHIDPDTGEKTYFYPDGKGGFEPIQKKDQGSDTNPIDHYLGTGDTGGDSADSGATDAGLPDEGAADMAPDQPEQGPVPKPAGNHTMEIYNGPHRTEVTFDPSGKIVNQTGAWQGQAGGQPPEPQGVGGDYSSLGITKQHLQQAQSLAKLLTPKPFLTGNKAHDAVTMRKYHEDIDRTQRMVLANQMKTSQAAAAEKRVIDREQRQKDKELTHTQQEDLYQKKLKEIQHDIDKKEKDLGPKETMASKYPNNPELWDREAHEAEAHARAKRDMKRVYGKDWSGGQSSEATGTGAASSAPAASAPKAPVAEQKPIQQTGATLQDLLAEKARREAAKNPKAPPVDQGAMSRRFP